MLMLRNKKTLFPNTLPYLKTCSIDEIKKLTQKVEYDQEIPQSHLADTNPRHQGFMHTLILKG